MIGRKKENQSTENKIYAASPNEIEEMKRTLLYNSERLTSSDLKIFYDMKTNLDITIIKEEISSFIIEKFIEHIDKYISSSFFIRYDDIPENMYQDMIKNNEHLERLVIDELRSRGFRAKVTMKDDSSGIITEESRVFKGIEISIDIR